MTIFTMRHGAGLEPVTGPDVKFMDGLLMYERDGRVLFASQHGGIVEVDDALMEHARWELTLHFFWLNPAFGRRIQRLLGFGKRF